MKAKFVHLKTPQKSIIESSFVDLNDIGLIMTPKHRCGSMFSHYKAQMINDPIFFSLFTGFQYQPVDDPKKVDPAGFNADRTFFENSAKVSMLPARNTFFGFPNVSAFNFYLLFLYGLYRHHTNEEYRKKLADEMESLNNICMVSERGGHYIPFYTALDTGKATYKTSFDNYVKALVENYHDEFIETAMDNSSVYNKCIQKYKDTACLFFEQLEYNVECENNFGTDFFAPRGSIMLNRTVREFLRKTMELPNNGGMPKLMKDSSYCHVNSENRTSDIPKKDRSLFIRMLEKDDGGSVFIEPITLSSVGVFRKDRPQFDLDVKMEQVYDMYNRQVGSLPPSGDWNASVVTDVEEYREYQNKINYRTRRLGIKATTKKAISTYQSPERFKLKVYYVPKSASSMIKVLRWIAEQDSNAKITNRTFNRGSTRRYVKTSASTGDKAIFDYCRNKMSESATKDETSPYEKFLNDSRNTYKSYSTVKHSKIIEYIANGWMDDEKLLTMIIDTYFGGGAGGANSTRVTFTMKCNDIKQLKKLKLMGIQFDNIEYDIADRKEVLEYFENY